MFARIAPVAVLAALGLAVSAHPAHAFGRHRPAPVHCPGYWEHHHFGPVYVVSPPSVPLFGKPITPIPLRAVPFGKGVIVEFTDPSGTPPHLTPTGLIQVIKTAGTGEIKYEGYNVRPPVPGLPGSPHVYSVFLLPTKPGKVEVKVGFVLSDNEIVNHLLAFDIEQVVYHP
ncbi:hypothetical protein [Frigoriglobus tundricola]|uniref:Uncharacterized protein n=1 Tax=Frigoriglobus tundricola TaxID=2774151 RepID=A0A6M5YJV8_9BACT|nr:hypothetical protein [Frigoriglobus tundricola]QJW93563.1 hypothetical protein FTUN_1070 [Frigoriglobus tundricola]